MLPLIGDGSPLTPEELQRLEREAAEAARTVPGGLRGPVFIAYAGSLYARAAAELIYWPLAQIVDGVDVRIGPVEAYTHHYTAYRDEDTAVILIAEHGSENTVARALATMRVMEARVVAVAPPLPGPAAAYAEADNVAYIETLRPRHGLYTVLVAAKLLVRLLENASGVRLRLERVRREYSEVAPVYEQLQEMYSEQAAKLAQVMRGGAAYYSPTMVAAASYLAYKALLRGGMICTAPLSGLPPVIAAGRAPDRIAVFYTDAEQDVWRESRFKLAMQRSWFVEVVLHTDPLTAPLYGILIVEAAGAEK